MRNTEDMGGPSVIDMPLVTVCIANYNGLSFVSACIESVLAQDVDYLIEILVHDDASTDKSADIVERDYPSVRMIRSETNVGFCVANNRMVAEAKGEFILLLNNDAELYSDALRVLLEKARSLGAKAILSVPQYDHHSGELIDRGCLLDPFFNPVPNLDPSRQEVAMVIGACFWIPRALWDELGGFPEWFGSIAEDMYLCCRARLAGYSIRVLGVSGYCHRVGQSFGGGKVANSKLSTTFRRRALSERNKTFVLGITCPSPFVLLLLPLHLFLLLIEGFLLTIFLRRVAYFKEIYLPVFRALLRRHVELRMERRIIMSGSRIPKIHFFDVFDPLPYKLRMLVRYGLPRVS